MTPSVNGTRRELDVDPHRTLGHALRDACGLTSVHLGCTDGTCGACTVLIDGEAVRSCLVLAVQCGGADVRTAEGLAACHRARVAVPAAGGAGCGRCAPGSLMLAAGAMAHDPALAGDPGRLRGLLTANVCHCDGPATGGSPPRRPREGPGA